MVKLLKFSLFSISAQIYRNETEKDRRRSMKIKGFFMTDTVSIVEESITGFSGCPGPVGPGHFHDTYWPGPLKVPQPSRPRTA